MVVQTVASAMEFDAAVQATTAAAVHFWAPWCIPCQQMDEVFAELAQQHPGSAFLRVEAEELSEISERYNVSMVPHFVIVRGGKKVSEVEGADAPALTAQVSQHLKQYRAAAPQQHVSASSVTSMPSPAGKSDSILQDRIKSLLLSARVLLFMKGTPDAPRCGFSAKVVAALRGSGISFSSFDILADDTIRQGLKEFSNWPTYPQLYANGELVGGCDIVLELHASHELKQTIEDALGTVGDSQQALNTRLKQLISSNSVMLFMKGTPAQPRCGFSSRVVQALNRTGLQYGTFDILEDEAVRQGLKAYSDWPTFPQLYAGGELVGGCDLIMELDQMGELKETLLQPTQ